MAKDNCEHIDALREYLKENNLEIGACGCCDSPWVDCTECKVSVGYFKNE